MISRTVKYIIPIIIIGLFSYHYYINSKCLSPLNMRDFYQSFDKDIQVKVINLFLTSDLPLIDDRFCARSTLIFIGNEELDGRPVDFDRNILFRFIEKEEHSGEGGLRVLSIGLIHLLNEGRVNEHLDSISSKNPRLNSYIQDREKTFAESGFSWRYAILERRSMRGASPSHR